LGENLPNLVTLITIYFFSRMWRERWHRKEIITIGRRNWGTAPGLPNGNIFWGLWENVGIFSLSFGIFIASWCTLRPKEVYYHLVYFSKFWYVLPTKIWQPWSALFTIDFLEPRLSSTDLRKSALRINFNEKFQWKIKTIPEMIFEASQILRTLESVTNITVLNH
jgi:hypothetical protein